MSRIGRLPIKVEKLNVFFSEKRVLNITNPENEDFVCINIPSYLNIVIENSLIKLSLDSSLETKKNKSMFGTLRQEINNFCIGLKEGFKKTIQFVGVGYKIKEEDSFFIFELGFSHPIIWKKKDEMKYTLEGEENKEKKILHLFSKNKYLVSQEAANIRNIKKPNRYDGKGVRYFDEKIILKPKKKKT